MGFKEEVRKFQNNLSYSFRTQVTEEKGDKVTVVLKTGDRIEILFKLLSDYIANNKANVKTYIMHNKPVVKCSIN